MTEKTEAGGFPPEIIEAAQRQMEEEPALMIIMAVGRMQSDRIAAIEAEAITLRQQNEDLKAAVAKVSLQITMLRQQLANTERESGHA